MAFPKGKPSLSIALIGAPHKGADGGDDMGHDDAAGPDEDHVRGAMEEFISAVKSADTDAAIDAFQALCDFMSAREDHDDAKDDEAEGDAAAEEEGA